MGVEGGWGVKDRQVKGVDGKPDWVSHDLVSLHKPEEGQPLPARRGGGGGRGYGKSPEEMRSIEMQVVFKGAMEAVIVGKLDAHEAVDVALQVWHDVVRGF